MTYEKNINIIICNVYVYIYWNWKNECYFNEKNKNLVFLSYTYIEPGAW